MADDADKTVAVCAMALIVYYILKNNLNNLNNLEEFMYKQ